MIRSGRRGFTVAETLVALLLLGLLLQLAWGVAAALQRGLTALTRRSEVLGAERAVWWVLARETEAGVAERDWTLTTPGVLALRAFRGRGVSCSSVVDPDGWIRVRYRGYRAPEPDKDSVLVLDDRGRWTPRDLVGRAVDEDACPTAGPSGGPERWRLDPKPARPTVVARLFERGSYHLEDAAFRYRRGRAGRQPLTPEVLDVDETSLDDGGAAGLILRFRGVASRLRGVAEVSDSGWTRVLPGG